MRDFRCQWIFECFGRMTRLKPPPHPNFWVTILLVLNLVLLSRGVASNCQIRLEHALNLTCWGGIHYNLTNLSGAYTSGHANCANPWFPNHFFGSLNLAVMCAVIFDETSQWIVSRFHYSTNFTPWIIIYIGICFSCLIIITFSCFYEK